MCANLSEESAIQISDGRPLSRSPEWGDHGGGQPHKQQQQHRQYQPHHRQHPHHHQSNQNYNHNLRHQSTKSAAAKTQDRHQQPAVWTWLNAIGADGARMVTPSHPCSPPTHVPPTDSPEFGTTTTSSFVRPLVRRRSTLPTNSPMSTHDGNSADASRINFAFDPRQQISTSGVLFGVSELFDWRPPHVDASHVCYFFSSSFLFFSFICFHPLFYPDIRTLGLNALASSLAPSPPTYLPWLGKLFVKLTLFFLLFFSPLLSRRSARFRLHRLASNAIQPRHQNGATVQQVPGPCATSAAWCLQRNARAEIETPGL